MMATLVRQFEEVDVVTLDRMDDRELDDLPFGVVGIDADGIACVYNKTEAKLAGLDRDRVIGQPFFQAIAQCMNNYLVAQRYEDEPTLDVIMPYVLTLRMRPTPVRMRLLASPGAKLRYLLIER